MWIETKLAGKNSTGGGFIARVGRDLGGKSQMMQLEGPVLFPTNSGCKQQKGMSAEQFPKDLAAPPAGLKQGSEHSTNSVRHK